MGKTNKKRANNEGTIIQLKNGRWRAQLSLGYKEDGTRNRPSNVFDTHAEAVIWKNSMLARAEEYGAESVKQNNGLFVPRYNKWMNEELRQRLESQQFYVAVRYYDNYIKPYFLKIKQTELTRDSFKSFFIYLEKQNVGLETRRKIKCLLHQYFENEFVNSPMRNPLDKVAISTKNKKKELLDPKVLFAGEDYKAIPVKYRQVFLDALEKETQNPFFNPLCYLMNYSGIRVGEALALQWKDFNFECRYFLIYKSVTREYEFDEFGHKIGKSKNIIKATKTKESIRPLALFDNVYEALMEWKELRKAQERVSHISFTQPNDYLFANDKGELRSEWGTNSMFQRFLKRNDLTNKGIHFHALRQTTSNSLFEKLSYDEEAIKHTMGHAQISTTKRNYHTIGKFDSVQKVARIFNELYPPHNSKYKADETVTYSPKGYKTENEGIGLCVYKSPEKPKETIVERDVKNLLHELIFFFVFLNLLKTLQS